MKLQHYLTKSLEHRQQSTAQDKIDSILLSKFRHTPFYCKWSNITNCTPDNPICFNHLIGLPKNKHGDYNPLFDYQKELFDTLQNKKMVYLLKATGLGITETMIRYIGWLCLKDDALQNTDIVIVTGPRLELSISIIDRLKKLFIDYVPSFDTRSTSNP